jgi:glycosyltransferase involved in cell wall biosynthesis
MLSTIKIRSGGWLVSTPLKFGLSPARSAMAVRSPTVSVIIAVKNAARYLSQCLDSVAAQTFNCYETLVIDGRSTDDTEAIARSYDKVSFFQQSGTGFANAWNCGLRQARGEFMTFIDSDDVWVPHKLACQIELLRGDPRLDAAIGKVRFVLEPGERPPRGFQAKVLGQNYVGHVPGVLMARRRLFERLGEWNEGFVVTNDVDWFAKLKDSGLPVGVVDDVLLHKRVHSRNLSYVMAEDRVYPQEMLRLLHASILRKRGAAADAEKRKGSKLADS